jgi:EAL domain-containing protein (putative c-di-GMP-specific phosphodiesterase class I)
MSVNVSAVEFHSEAFVDGVRTTLAETGLDAQWLEFELTERVLMQDIETTKTILLDLKAVGVRVAIDDFGTGYSSLSYLHRFPVDILKIDRSFISQITQDPADSRILEAILGIGKSLKLLVVAAGIETLSQQSYLWRHECAEAQGYLFSPPLSAERLAQLMDDGIGGEFKAFTLAGAA